MPKASSPLAPQQSHELTAAEVLVIKDTVLEFFGDKSLVRNFGHETKILKIHVETDRDIGMSFHGCLGVLNCKLAKDRIDLVVSIRGKKVRGEAKIAYRQGQIL